MIEPAWSPFFLVRACVCVHGCVHDGSSGGGPGSIGTAHPQKVMGLIQDGAMSSTMAREECK